MRGEPFSYRRALREEFRIKVTLKILQRERSSFVGSVSGGLAGRGCERKGPGRKAGEDRHEVSYPPEADHHKGQTLDLDARQERLYKRSLVHPGGSW